MAGSMMTTEVTTHWIGAVRVKPMTREAVIETAHEVADWASIFAPIDTGHLANESIFVEEDDAQEGFSMLVIVETADGEHDDYGEYVELGTVNMAAQPFLRPATVEARHNYLARLEAAFL